MPESYTDFAAIYDRLILEDINYTAIADYIESTLSRLGKKAELICSAFFRSKINQETFSVPQREDLRSRYALQE